MTDVLFNEPSFFSGMATVADLHGAPVPYNESATPMIADERALRADWLSVGKDLKIALDQFGASLKRG